MRVVVDTNVLISRYLAPHGTPAAVFLRWERRAFELLVSPPILDEYDRVMRDPDVRRLHQKSDSEIDVIIRRIRQAAIHVIPTQKLALIPADPDDDKFVECAVEGKARYIVSGDKHLLGLGSYQGIQVVPPAAFVTLVAVP
jgi:putative PIN family toxin of toxin-antitoxin system